MPLTQSPASAEMPLAEAALTLRRTWAQTYDLLLRGDLQGRKVGARWWITRESVERVQADRATATMPAA